MEQILIQLEALLREYDFTREANLVAGICKLQLHHPEQAYQLMIDEAWWVGADAVAEANIAIAGGFTPDARHDQDKFQTLIIELYQLLNQQGYDSEHAKLVTTQYNKWLVSRV